MTNRTLNEPTRADEVIEQGADVAFWSIASFRCPAEDCRYRGIADIVRTVGYAFRLCFPSYAGQVIFPARLVPPAKDFPLCPTGKSSLQARPVSPHRGAARDRHGREAGCDGRKTAR